MPLVFHSPMPGAGRATMRLAPKEILHYRDKMYELEKALRKVKVPSGSSPVNEISLSGSFPKEEILAMIIQNADCTHISFMTGFDKDRKHYTLIVPMKGVIPGDTSSGEIIDELNTFYSSICCEHPPFIGK